MLTINTDLNKVLKLGHPCRCPSCENPCSYGSGVLADGDLEKISKHLGISEEDAKKNYFEEIEKFNTKRLRPKILRENDNPYGKCIFFEKDNGCKIHEVKPLECKIAMGCKSYGEELITWFDMKHFLNPKDIESLRQFRNYVESGGNTLPGAEIKDLIDEEMMKKIDSYDDLKLNEDWESKLGLKQDKENKKDK